MPSKIRRPKYATEDGWYRATGTRISGGLMSEDELKSLVAERHGESVDAYEWADFRVFETRVRIFFREKE